MKNMISKVMNGIQALVALVLLGAIKIWAPVCQSMLTLENGKQVHMKFFYSGQAAIALAVVIFVAAVVAFLSKKDYKKVQIINIVCGIFLFLVFTSLIGVCANPDMSCNVTAVWGKAAAGVVIVASVIDILTGKEGQIPA